MRRKTFSTQRLAVVFALIGLALTACGPRTLVVGLEPGTLHSDESPVKSVAFSPDGALLASGSQDGTVRVWRAGRHSSDFALLMALRISTGDVEASHSSDVAFSPDSSRLAFGLPDGSVHLWRLGLDRAGDDTIRNLEITSLETLRVDGSKICSLDFAPDGQTLAAGSGDGSVHLWRTADRTHVRSLEAHTNSVVSVSYSPDGTMLASAALDGAMRLWDPATGRMIDEQEGSAAVTGVAFSPDGSLVAVTTSTGKAQLWSVDGWFAVRDLESARGGMGNVAFSPDGTMVAAGNAWYEVAWWQTSNGALLAAETAHRDSVNSVSFSPDGETLASASLDGAVKLWHVPAVR